MKFLIKINYRISGMYFQRIPEMFRFNKRKKNHGTRCV